MRYLLTGAGGFWGRHVVAELSAKGEAWASMGVGRKAGRGHFTLRGVSDVGSIRQTLETVRPDVILHLAGAVPPAPLETMEDVNSCYAQAILEAMRAVGFAGRFVAVGSAAEYGPVAEALLPLREDTQARPVSFHGSSKLAQTEQVLAAGMSGADVTVLRTFNLLGPAMPSQLILPSLARRMLAGCGRMLRVANIDSTRDFMDVQDATRILLAVARVPDASGQIVNCCTQRETRVGTLAEMAARHLGLALEIEPDMESPPDPNPRSVGSVQKLFRLVGAWNFKPLEQSVSETLDHMTKS